MGNTQQQTASLITGGSLSYSQHPCLGSPVESPGQSEGPNQEQAGKDWPAGLSVSVLGGCDRIWPCL